MYSSFHPRAFVKTVLFFMLGVFICLFITSAHCTSSYTASLLSAHEAVLYNNNPPPTSNQAFRDVLIISCSGKCGSCTLETSFRALGLETYRCHVIDNNTFNFILERERQGRVILIDSIRDIISRKIASFFQNITTHLNLSPTEIIARYKENPINFVQTLQEKFKEKIFWLESYNTFNSWKLFNYNCLTDGVFDFEKKYQLKKAGNLYFINLRFDDIKDWDNILKSIELPIDLSRFKIIGVNQSSNKWYKDIYRDFLANFTLTRHEFDTILSSVSVELTHFYTAEEIDAFINKWTPYIR